VLSLQFVRVLNPLDSLLVNLRDSLVVSPLIDLVDNPLNVRRLSLVDNQLIDHRVNRPVLHRDSPHRNHHVILQRNQVVNQLVTPVVSLLNFHRASLREYRLFNRVRFRQCNLV